MNAVERLLAHGELALRFFGDVYRKADLGPLWDEAEPVAQRAVELLDRGWHGWQSRAFLLLAVLRALDAKPRSRPAEAMRIYRELLAERRHLLSSKKLGDLLADVVAASPAWGSLSRDVVLRAEAASDALRRLRSIEGDPSPYGGELLTFSQWAELRMPLRKALRRLRGLKHPPAAPGPTGRSKASRPPHRPMVDEDLQRELRDGWRDFAKRYDGEGRPTHKQYIAMRCRGQRKGTAEQAALETLMLRTLETALANHRRKRRQLEGARTK